MKITYKKFSLCMLFLYILANFAYQLGTGFDAILVRASFVLFVGGALLSGKKIKVTSGLKWAVIFWLWYFVSVLWSNSFGDALRYVNEAIQIIGLMVCIPLVVQDREDINLILKFIVMSMFYASILLLIRTPATSWGTERVGIELGLHPNTLSINTALASAVTWHFFHENTVLFGIRSRRIKGVVCIALIALFGGVNLLTGSKKGIFALVVYIVVYELLITRNWDLILKVAAIVVVLGIVAYFVFTNPTLYTILGRRIYRFWITVQGTATGVDVDGSYTERQYYIERAKELFAANPIIGYGANGFVTYMKEIGYYHIAYSHNNFLELLCTLGIIGFVIYYFYWIRTELKLLKRFFTQDDHLILLFAIIFATQLIMDYAMVSYVVVFMYILLECANRLLYMPGSVNDTNAE